MKKIYLSLLTGLFFSQLANAQLSLTMSFNQPVVGNVEARKGYDSLTASVPKTTGANQTWNFTNFTANSNTTSSTYTTPAAVPSSSAYPGVTMVEDMGSGNYNFWKASSSPTYELLGTSATTIAFNYTNSAITDIWPVALGYTNIDTYSGTVGGGTFSGTLSGTVITVGSGSGTLIIPGGGNFTNILQVKAINVVTVNITSPIATTLGIAGIDYMYYHSSQKFPLMTVSYQNQGTGNTGAVWMNNLLITGLNDKNFDATFAIFPNPAKEAFNVKLTNADNENGTVFIYNAVGQVVKTIALGNAPVLENTININDLAKGIYIVKTSLGNKSSARRLVVE